MTFAVVVGLLGGVARAAPSSLEAGRSEAEPSTDNALFLELLGAAPWASVNYERRVAGEWTLRAGVGGLFADLGEGRPQRYLQTPISVSYLVGREWGSHRLEVGGGVVPSLHTTTGEVGLGGMLSLGYRYQPAQSGLLVRAGVTGLFKGVAAPYPLPLPGISAGWRF